MDREGNGNLLDVDIGRTICKVRIAVSDIIGFYCSIIRSDSEDSVEDVASKNEELSEKLSNAFYILYLKINNIKKGDIKYAFRTEEFISKSLVKDLVNIIEENQISKISSSYIDIIKLFEKNEFGIISSACSTAIEKIENFKKQLSEQSSDRIITAENSQTRNGI